MRRLPDGGLEWTTPGGDRITTHPPRFGTDDPDPPGGALADDHQPAPPLPHAAPLTATERACGRPLPPGTDDDDPPPF